MSNPITLILKDRRGNTLDLFDISDFTTPLTIDAVEGAYYQFNDEMTGLAPPIMRCTRVGEALHITFGDNVRLVIAHYYSCHQGALIGLQENGRMQRYPLGGADDIPPPAF